MSSHGKNNKHFPTPSTDRVARRAYEIWQIEGCPEGRSVEHWRMAEQLLCAESKGGKPSQPVQPSRATVDASPI